MKVYIVFANGVEVGVIRAGGHNAAEKKATKLYGPKFPGQEISVAYTEL